MTESSESITTAAADRPLLRRLRGVVTAAKATRTIKVQMEYQTRHPKYGKYLQRRTVLQVHDEQSQAREGDTVEIAECRPISKTKHHRLLRVIERGAAFVKAEEPSKMFEAPAEQTPNRSPDDSPDNSPDNSRDGSREDSQN
jgi:small subunit ribosomal protein S17